MAAALVFYACLAVAALMFTEPRIGPRGHAALRHVYALAHLPEQPLGQTWAEPALVRGTLHTPDPRPSPSGRPSALWYAWVEQVTGSGRNTTTTVVCVRHELMALQLHAGEHTARLELFDDENSGALLKGKFLESLPPEQVALDLGAIYQSRTIPRPMQVRCLGRIPTRGTLTYYEAYVPSGGAVTVMGCASPGVVQGCGDASRPPGFITVRGPSHLLRAYANGYLDSVRGAAIFVGLTLSLLAATIFKLREAVASRP